MLTIKKIIITRRYLSTNCWICKTIYLFDLPIQNRKIMIKILVIIGLVLIGGTVYSYLGMIGHELRWPVFFGCAVGALAIIIYRKKIRQRENKP
jgi:hypothetical protein